MRYPFKQCFENNKINLLQGVAVVSIGQFYIIFGGLMSVIKNIKGTYYLLLGILLFVIFVLIDNITQLSLGSIFGGTFIDWKYSIQILSKIIPAILWMVLFAITNKLSINKLNFNFMQPNKKVPLTNYFISTLFVIIAILFNYMSWGNFKLLVEYKNAGLIGFIAQHIYYFSEIIIVVTLIVIFQKMFETWLKKTSIPYGGIVVAITWGLVHIFTQNSIVVGLLAFVYGFGFGSIYLILNRNYKLTVIFLFLMFVL